MEFRILGPLEVRDGVGVVPLPRRRERVLLAALLLRPGEVVSTHRLIDALWGEAPPRTAMGSLQNGVSELRRVLGADAVETRPPGYLLAVEPEAIDAVRFERAVRQAARLDPAERAWALSGALELWRGPALADLAEEPFAQAEAARLDELRVAATEDRLDAELALGRGPGLVAELESHVAANPLRERLRAQLMLALYRSGRQAEALDAYQSARRALVDGLGLEPSAALQDLERQILRQDPALLVQEEPSQPPAPAVAVATRKTVTVLAAGLHDVSDVDPERLRGRVDRFLAALGQAAVLHGGALDRFLGSDAAAVFGIPAAHEDDALRATRAAVDLRDALTAHGVAVRVGIATGEALVRAEDSPVVGDVVAVAAALRDAAAPGGILIDERTHELTRDAVAVGEPVAAGHRELPARPLEAAEGARGRARRVDTPFIDREGELAALRAALARATERGRCVAVSVLGDAGIGKTRLAERLGSALGPGHLLMAGCAPYGQDAAPFRPVLDLVGRASPFGLAAAAELLPETEEGRLAARWLAGLADPAAAVPRGDAFWAFRVLFDALARDGPMVAVLDDLHWAEPPLLDLVEYLVERVARPVVLVCLARPELVDERPGWAGAASAMEVLRLGPLGAGDARELVDALAPEAVGAKARRRIVERGEGNALHLEQLQALVADEGDAALDGVPPTIEAVLASRVDRLSPALRDTLQRSAVAGVELTRGLAVALCEPDAPADASLQELTRRGLLHVEEVAGADDGYRFHHALLRDVAYRRLSKELRADLHERAAAWLGGDGAGRDEIVGTHLERAYLYRTELTGDPDAYAALATAAGERLGEAGMRAARSSLRASAASLLRRATELLPPGARRALLLCELAPALRAVRDPVGALAAVDQALADARQAGEPAVTARAEIEQLWEIAPRSADLPAALRRLREPLEAAGDDRGLARAWHLAARSRLHRLQMARYGEAARHATEHARLAGWFPLASVNSQGAALVYGPVAVDDALAQVEALVREVDGSAHAVACLEKHRAVLLAMRGQAGGACELIERSRAALEEFDDRLMLLTGWTPHRLAIHRLLGERAEALALLDDWSRQLAAAGDDAYLATAHAHYADLVLPLDAGESARRLAAATQLVAEDDVLVGGLITSVRARLAALAGDVERARRHAADSLARFDERAGVDALNDRARACIDAAGVHGLCGDEPGREALLAEAEQLLERKGNVRALRSLATLGEAALT